MSETRARTFRFPYSGTIKSVLWVGLGELQLAEPVAVKAGEEITIIWDDDNLGRLLEPPKVKP